MNLLRRLFSVAHIILHIWHLKLKYRIALQRIRHDYRRRPLRVAFFVSEVAKWKGQSLYDLMDSSANFAPTIIVYPMRVETTDSFEMQQEALDAKVQFFRSKKMAVRDFWSIDKQCFRIDEMADYDLCFYQQPWDLPPAPFPHQIASRSLSFYFPYGIGSYAIGAETNKVLHREVYRYILLDNRQARDIENERHWIHAGKIVGWGNPVVDNFRRKAHVHVDEGYVIYAPHFSFPLEGETRIFPASTFLDNGRQILSFAKAHPEIKWAFKPHPRLRRELVDTGVWTEEEVNNYYKEWETIGTACYTSDYADLFMVSRVMITDCGSFLAEYSCTGNPIIHLIPGKLPAKPFSSLEPLFHYFYQAPDNSRLAELLDSIVLKGEDPLKKERLECLTHLELTRRDVAQNILQEIDNLLR